MICSIEQIMSWLTLHSHNSTTFRCSHCPKAGLHRKWKFCEHLPSILPLKDQNPSAYSCLITFFFCIIYLFENLKKAGIFYLRKNILRCVFLKYFSYNFSGQQFSKSLFIDSISEPNVWNPHS